MAATEPLDDAGARPSPGCTGLSIQWTRTADGKSVTKLLTREQLERRQPGFDNACQLRELATRLETISIEAISQAGEWGAQPPQKYGKGASYLGIPCFHPYPKGAHQLRHCAADQADSRYGVGSSDFQGAVDRLSHRGPDGRGTVAVGTARLGHRRLAIVDVEGGDQSLRAGDHYLVANGEIYNHQVLRGRLRGPFTTGSDNEAILRLVAEQGCEALPALRGMYAFCLATAAGGFVAARGPCRHQAAVLGSAQRDGAVRL